jgi:ferredoxin--NADP+ reductase
MNKILIHGGRTLDSFYFAEEFKPFFKENYVRCCSQETSPEVFGGRLTSYLRTLQNLPPEYNYYLCGLAEMVVETRDVLISKGVPFNNILAEIYF